MIKVKFPSGQTAHELLHYMGIDHIQERPEVAQRLVGKCFAGKTCELQTDELDQLIKEVENALDIKSDHIGDGSWTQLQQNNLLKYLSKLQSVRPKVLCDGCSVRDGHEHRCHGNNIVIHGDFTDKKCECDFKSCKNKQK